MSNYFRNLPEINNTREQIQLRNRKKYEKMFLARNPFPLGGNFPEGYIDYTYLEENQRRTIDDFLLHTFDRGEFNGMLILGEYGTGKTHLLNYIADIVNGDRLGVFGGVAVAFIIQNPGLAPEDIVLSLLRTIKLPTVQDLIFLPVRRKLQDQYRDNAVPFLEKFTNFSGQLKINNVAEEPAVYTPPWYNTLFAFGYREFRNELEKRKITIKGKEIREYSKEVLFAEVSDNPLIVDSLVSLIFEDGSKLAGNWENFIVSNFFSSKGQAIGIEYFLEAFLKLFEIMGIYHVYLLVDELEDLRTQRIGKKAATEYLAALRRMIQHNYKRFSFVLTSARDAWDDLKLLYPAIEDRFPVKIELVRNPEAIKKVILKYLTEERAKNNITAPSDWYPFEEAAIDRLISLRGIVLRHVITECRKLIDFAIEEGTNLPIDVNFVEKNIVITSFP